ncbi:putative Fe-S oxidoreductase [Desulfosporosinus acidiphilus SJ4]|uniref:Putative Fe-S oxidoreductase n=1 Tax=Desulfosporosinus acidiphilus (strain DSM 22704 / JCM 16185 / SJ4) TaxID=646529 RepID=I4D1Z2_DESAJ|nr:YkgJ family cysteine cluster protein [Desulfosporosinus acidiphilus]AFM39816.1 putative Fe-S oxidoreductase [Desulfosporosinus acidiphilus SJ4]
MNSLPCQECRGLCCGPVPITKHELDSIRRVLKLMPENKRFELKNQQRYFGTCIFYDLDKDICGIHNVRPSICRAFGHYSNLVCFRKPEASTELNWVAAEDPIGILSVDFTWQHFN